jgi:hypothetical protein
MGKGSLINGEIKHVKVDLEKLRVFGKFANAIFCFVQELVKPIKWR